MTARPSSPSENAPLVVDLDGTLIASDTLIESAFRLCRRQPSCLLLMLRWLLRGRSALKAEISARSPLDVATLPWRPDVVEWVREQKHAGRTIVLATAADRRIATAVAEHLGLFDDLIASDEAVNRKGARKLEAIRTIVGDAFVYAGDSAADLSVWSGAAGAVLVAPSDRVLSAVRRMEVPIERIFPRTSTVASKARVWLRAMRVHQWVKNLLLFVPLLTSFTFTDPVRAWSSLLLFVAFSLTASGTYILNDLYDLESDRRHPRKRARPFASGALSIIDGIGGAALLLFAGVAVASAVSPVALLLVVGYVVLTTFYSWTAKGYVLMDVILLALLYTYRVMAGGLSIDVRLSPWLLAFSVFVFLSLALVKRCGELLTMQLAGRESSHGRDYRVGDLAVLWPLGVGAALSAALVFGLFIGSPEAKATYGETTLLWPVGIFLIYWLARMWIKTARGEMHDDPIVFAMRDRGSRVAIGAMAAIPIIARFIQ